MPRGARLVARVFFALTIVSTGGAQTTGTPGQTPAPIGVIDPSILLKSGDARKQAWAAWYVGRDYAYQLAPVLQHLVRQRLGVPWSTERAVVEIALDSLIQMGTGAALDFLEALYEHYPAQALILASRSEGADEFLLRVVRNANSHEWFAAANMLVGKRSPHLAQDLLEPLRLKLTIYVTDPTSGGIYGGGARSGGAGCGAGGPAPGMPPWAAYTLSSFARPGMTVLAPGPVAIYYERRVAPAGEWPTPNHKFIGGPTADDRLVYLGALAGLESGRLPLKGEEQRSVAWHGAEHLAGEVDRFRADFARRYAELMTTLVSVNVLSVELARRQPPIDVTIEDYRRAR